MIDDYDDCDKAVMAIEDIFVVYEPELRKKLKDQITSAVSHAA